MILAPTDIIFYELLFIYSYILSMFDNFVNDFVINFIFY